LIGLLGAALGVERADELAQARLRDGYAFAVQVFAAGRSGADYHTAQMPSRGKTRYATRRDELAGKQELNTVLTSREYRFDFMAGLAVSAQAGAPYTLEKLADALRAPHYTLSLGRKSCALGLPLSPDICEAPTPQAALTILWRKLQVVPEGNWRETPVQKVIRALRAAPGEIILERAQYQGEAARIEFVRDQPLSRRRWQFGLREAIILPPPSEAAP
jgi:CRISPR system Cascade subunit CasD